MCAHVYALKEKIIKREEELDGFVCVRECKEERESVSLGFVNSSLAELYIYVYHEIKRVYIQEKTKYYTAAAALFKKQNNNISKILIFFLFRINLKYTRGPIIVN